MQTEQHDLTSYEIDELKTKLDLELNILLQGGIDVEVDNDDIFFATFISNTSKPRKESYDISNTNSILTVLPGYDLFAKSSSYTYLEEMKSSIEDIKHEKESNVLIKEGNNSVQDETSFCPLENESHHDLNSNTVITAINITKENIQKEENDNEAENLNISLNEEYNKKTDIKPENIHFNSSPDAVLLEIKEDEIMHENTIQDDESESFRLKNENNIETQIIKASEPKISEINNDSTSFAPSLLATTIHQNEILKAAYSNDLHKAIDSWYETIEKEAFEINKKNELNRQIEQESKKQQDAMLVNLAITLQARYRGIIQRERYNSILKKKEALHNIHTAYYKFQMLHSFYIWTQMVSTQKVLEVKSCKAFQQRKIYKCFKVWKHCYYKIKNAFSSFFISASHNAIKKYWKMWKIYSTKINCITIIQHWFRRQVLLKTQRRHIFTKKKFQAWKMYVLKKKENAIIMIQCFIYRYHCAKKLREQQQYLLQRKNNIVVKVQSIVRGHLAQQKFVIFKQQVSRIRCNISARKIQRFFLLIKQLHYTKASIQIQRYFRGYYIRKIKLYPILHRSDNFMFIDEELDSLFKKEDDDNDMDDFMKHILSISTEDDESCGNCNVWNDWIPKKPVIRGTQLQRHQQNMIVDHNSSSIVLREKERNSHHSQFTHQNNHQPCSKKTTIKNPFEDDKQAQPYKPSFPIATSSCISEEKQHDSKGTIISKTDNNSIHSSNNQQHETAAANISKKKEIQLMDEWGLTDRKTVKAMLRRKKRFSSRSKKKQ